MDLKNCLILNDLEQKHFHFVFQLLRQLKQSKELISEGTKSKLYKYDFIKGLATDGVSNYDEKTVSLLLIFSFKILLLCEKLSYKAKIYINDLLISMAISSSTNII